MLRSLLPAAVAAGVLTSPGWAVTRHVPADHPTIQAGLDASGAGDTVLVAPGIYTDSETRLQPGGFEWTSCAFMVDGVTLRSEGGPAVTMIDMQQASGPQPQVILARYQTSGQTTVEGFTVTGARTGGRGVFTSFSGLITFRHCLFRDLDAGESTGGGIAANSDLLLDQCEFVNCLASGGGAIYHANGRIEMYACTFRACGSIAALLSGSGEPPLESSYIEGCTFEDCWGSGAAALSIQQHHGGTIVRNCRFVGNIGGGTGALGMSGFPTTPKLVETCLFWNNRAAGGNGQGGGLSAGGPATVRGNTFYGNTAVSVAGGAAVDFDGGGAQELLNNVIAACGSTGAVEAWDSTVTSACNVFWDNPGGLGMYYTPGPTDRIVDPLFCDPAGGDFRVATGSPCLPEGSIGCGLIGAFGEGCGVVAVEPTSWGEIKAAYRSQEGGRR